MNILQIKNEDGSWTDIPAIAGKTPVKGVDYFTESDKQELVRLVIEALPAAEGVKL